VEAAQTNGRVSKIANVIGGGGLHSRGAVAAAGYDSVRRKLSLAIGRARSLVGPGKTAGGCWLPEEGADPMKGPVDLELRLGRGCREMLANWASQESGL